MGNALPGVGLVFGKEVEEFRQGAGIFFLEEESSGFQKFDNIAVVIIQISEGADLGGTGGLAGRSALFRYTVVAERAFIDRHPGIVYKSGIIGTCLHAAFAEDALFPIHLDDAAGFIMTCICRTDTDAGRIDALVALRRIGVGKRFAECRAFDETYPDALFARTQLHPVFLFAGNLAGLTVDAVLIIQCYCIIHNHTFLTDTSVSCMTALPKTGSMVPSIISLSLAPFLWANV